MIPLLVAIAVGIAVAAGGAIAVSHLAVVSGVANGSPSHASLYQYGNR